VIRRINRRSVTPWLANSSRQLRQDAREMAQACSSTKRSDATISKTSWGGNPPRPPKTGRQSATVRTLVPPSLQAAAPQRSDGVRGNCTNGAAAPFALRLRDYAVPACQTSRFRSTCLYEAALMGIVNLTARLVLRRRAHPITTPASRTASSSFSGLPTSSPRSGGESTRPALPKSKRPTQELGARDARARRRADARGCGLVRHAQGRVRCRAVLAAVRYRQRRRCAAFASGAIAADCGSPFCCVGLMQCVTPETMQH